MPWQRHVVDIALEYDPDTGELWYEEVVITVPRQSGKTTLLLALMVWRCTTMSRRLGLPQIVTYLAQSGKMARRKLEREFFPKLRKADGFAEVPHSRARPVKVTDWKPSMNNGSEHILFGTGSYLQIEAPTATGSHGEVLDMPVIDEAFARSDDVVEQAVDAATVTRRSPQTFVISTAGNESSFFLWRKVLAGRAAICGGGRSAYFEWSLPDDVDYSNPEIWAEYLPALGHTITEARLRTRLQKALANPEEIDADGFEPGLPGFLRGYMNRWIATPTLAGQARPPEVTSEAWAGCVDTSSQIVGQCVIGVGVSANGVSGAMVVVGRRADGVAHVETLVVDGELWRFETRLREFVQKWKPAAVAWHNSGPTRAFAPEISRAAALHQGCEANPINTAEWKAACASFARAVNDKTVKHLGDVWLQAALIGGFRRNVGDGWEWDVNAATVDISPLLAATAALRALETVPAVKEFFVY
jgi:phage terminase large subunit-like protein